MIENYSGMWTGGLFLWMAIILVIGIGLTLLVRWLRDRSLRTTWYDWLIVLVGIFLLLFTIQNFYGSWAEGVPQASWMFALVTGLPSLVLLAITAVQIWRRNRTA